MFHVIIYWLKLLVIIPPLQRSWKAVFWFYLFNPSVPLWTEWNRQNELQRVLHIYSTFRNSCSGEALQRFYCDRGRETFPFECCTYEELRFILDWRVTQLCPQYQYLDSDQKLVYLFEIENEQLITRCGKFVYIFASNHTMYYVYRLLNLFLYLMSYGIIPPVIVP